MRVLGGCVRVTHNERPEEEGEHLVELEQVPQQHEDAHQALQGCSCAVLEVQNGGETHKGHEESHLHTNGNTNE